MQIYVRERQEEKESLKSRMAPTYLALGERRESESRIVQGELKAWGILYLFSGILNNTVYGEKNLFRYDIVVKEIYR